MDLCKFQSVQFAHVEGSDILPALEKNGNSLSGVAWNHSVFQA